ncbi:hypothetical protein [Providencia manganoxydans]|uniref:hypothetical protein n=1 Tax=Providencia manganoxydans TaxID=2923283 RepID=UPI0034E41C6B
MNPFLSKRFIILTIAFITCLVATIAFHFRGNAASWTWENKKIGSEIANFDWVKTFPTDQGMLIVVQRSQRASYYSYSRYNIPSHDYSYQVLLANKTGIHYIGKGNHSFYNAACNKAECTLIFNDGSRVLNLADYSITDMEPWQEPYGEQYSTLIIGKILNTPNDQTYLVVSNSDLFKTTDKGRTWQLFGNVRDLVKLYYPEKLVDNSHFLFATQKNKLIVWFSYGNNMGSLEITINSETGKILGNKWLPLRINEVEQSPNGDIYAIAQEPSRKLFSLLQFQDNGEFSVVTENGYSQLYGLQVSNQTALLNETWRGEQGYLLVDVKDNQLTHRAELNEYDKTFNSVDNTFIKLGNSYLDDVEIANGDLVSHQIAK